MPTETEKTDPPAGNGVPRLDYRDFQRTGVILSGYRSGSHLLKLSLAALAQMQGPPEPLNSRHRGPDGFTLADYLALDAPRPSTITHGPGAFHDFLARFYRSTLPVRRVLFDLKYAQAFQFGVNGDMDLPLPVPVVLEEFAKLGVPVIHLVRRDVVAQAVSLLLAEENGIYLTRAGAEGGAGRAPVRLSPRDVLRAARRFHHARLHFDAVLAALGMRTLHLTYENLAGPDGTESLRAALRFLGRHADVPAGFTPPTRRQSSTDAVINIDDIRAHVRQRAPELLLP